MNTVEFFENLGILYSSEEDASTYKKRICLYANLLDEKLKTTNRQPDFEATVEHIAEDYPYRAFPTFNYIVENLKYKPLEKGEKFQSNIKLRGFRVKTNIGVYDFWDYLPKDEKVESIRGFTDIEEIDCD